MVPRRSRRTSSGPRTSMSEVPSVTSTGSRSTSLWYGRCDSHLTHEADVTGLNPSMLATLPGDLPAPRYERVRVRTGIVHIGLGGFARAHLAMYLHRLMEQGEALDWG